LFNLSQISKKAICVTSCFLVLPCSLTLSAKPKSEGNLQQIILAQATTPEVDSTNNPKAAQDTQKPKPAVDTETDDDKKLKTYNLEFNRSPIFFACSSLLVVATSRGFSSGIREYFVVWL
jgi:cellulose synthase operon protein B